MKCTNPTFVNRLRSGVRSCVALKPPHPPTSPTQRPAHHPSRQPPTNSPNAATTGSSHEKPIMKLRKQRQIIRHLLPLRHNVVIDRATSYDDGLEGQTVSPVFAFSASDAII